ncbi:MAG: MFS transporter, partial [Planctomycetes bacterium]|nr:MFS transporter [Planctomycetota bacterium]
MTRPRKMLSSRLFWMNMANAPNPNPDTPARSTQPEPIELRRSLQLVMLAWVFGAAWMFTTTGAALTQYAKLLQMPPFGFGLLAALPFLGALAQLPTSFLIERYGHRKGLFLVSGIIHRLLWVAIALIPWMTPDAWWWPALLTLMLLSSLGGHVVAPTWISWMADLVPARIRGRYFSRRLQAGQLVGACVTLLIGTVLDRAQAAGAHTLMQTVSAALALAGVVGAVDFICFLPVPDPGHIRPDPRVSFWDLLRRPLADRNFRRFLGFNATVTFSLGYIGQFVWLYLFDVVGLSNMQANLMLMVAPLLALMIVYPIWGRLIDKLGRKPVLVIACLLVVHGGSSWVFVTREHWVLGYAAVMLAIAAWPGIELASFNIVLGMSTSHGGRRQGSAYVAINSLVTA